MPEVLRYAAFTTSPEGGNPAGVVLDATELGEAEMQAIAAEVGYSETAFVVARGVDGEYDVRFFSPQAEVPFCGHATIATAVALARRDGPGRIVVHCIPGAVVVDSAAGADGPEATLTSVPPTVEEPAEGLVDAALAALGWAPAELEAAMPPRVAFAGARHLVLAAATRERLAALDYDFDALRALMLAHDLTTVALVWRADAATFHVRNPFPVGGVVEDPATGAAAAAFGGYLRALDLVTTPTTLALHQGADMGRPSLLRVGIDRGDGGIRVTGNAVAL